MPKDDVPKKGEAKRDPAKPQGAKPGSRGQDGPGRGTREVRPGGHEPGTKQGPKPKRPQAATATKGGK